MDSKLVNPFLNALKNIFPQLGFENVEKQNVRVKPKNLNKTGVIVSVGVAGDFEGSVIYYFSKENAKKIASTMMKQEVTELSDMAKSALSELANMLTANAGVNLSENDVNINISPPIIMYGNELNFSFNNKKVMSVIINVDEIPVEAIISLI